MAGRFHRLLALASLSVVALATAVPGVAAGATPAATKPVTFDVSIGSPCILVDGPKRTVGTLAVRGPGGKLRGQAEVRLGTDGQESECLYSILTGVAGGDIVSFRTGGVRTSWRVPRLSMSIDRTTDRYIVRGAPGTAVAVLGMRGGVMGTPRTLFGFDQLTIGPGGVVERDPGVDLLGTDMLTAMVEDGENGVMLAMSVPFISVVIGDALVSGAVAPGPDAVVRLSRGGSVLGRASAAEIYPGQFFARLRDAEDQPVYARPGDRVVVAGPSTVSMRVQPATVRADPRTDTITGTCRPDTTYAIWAQSPFFSDRFLFVQLRGRTDATGAFRRVLREDLRKGDELRLICQDPKGDLTRIERVIPR